MQLEEALKTTGFEKCEFPADNDPCEKCDKPDLQLYYRRTDHWENEGTYYCEGCVIEHAKEIASVITVECPQCGDTFPGWPEQKGEKCFDCYAGAGVGGSAVDV